MIDLKQVIEALIFAADAPLSVARIREILDDDEIDSKLIRSVCQELREEYDQTGRAFELTEVADGFRIRTRPEFSDLIIRLRKTNPLRLSRAALETLAIVAYKQPVLRAEIERIRGVDCGGVLKALMERGLVRIRGRENLPGRPLTYGTTRRFLEVFELKSIGDLPSLEELALEAGLDPTLTKDIRDSMAEDAPALPELFPKAGPSNLQIKKATGDFVDDELAGPGAMIRIKPPADNGQPEQSEQTEPDNSREMEQPNGSTGENSENNS